MFIYNLENIAKKLKIDFEGITKQIGHNGIKGSIREDLLKEYLRKLLPEKYTISSGIIIDNAQCQSKQQDFIIHDSFDCPSFFKTDSNSILPVESVYATIEVKSTLNYTTLEQSTKNIESVRKLKKLSNNNIIKKEYDDVYPLGFVFAYTSNCSLEQLQKKLFEFNSNIDYQHRISMICVLDKGLIFNVKKENITEFTLVPTNDSLIGRSDSNIENSLYSFYLFLIDYLNSVNIGIPSLIEYAQKSDAFKVSLKIPGELIPEDAIFKHENIKANYGDIMKMMKLNERYPNLFNGKMTYEELFKYLKNDFVSFVEMQAKINNFKEKNVNIYGYTFNDTEFEKFEQYILTYDISEKSKEMADKIINEIYKMYKTNVESNGTICG